MFMEFDAVFTSQFDRDIKSLKRDRNILGRLEMKIKEILSNPEHYKPLKNVLKGKRRVHIGSFVILFEIEATHVIFLRFEHHDKVYF